VKLLFDENLSRRLVERLAASFPGSTHVDDLRLRGRPDSEVRKAAADQAALLVTKDSDFLELSLLHGAPPKVVWLRVGNAGTEAIAELLLRNKSRLELFAANDSEALLELSGETSGSGSS
jgi:predicted nuclease of predicted toxin-antitoxin system